jgi:uncharacterized membrane-anchored protein
LQVPPGKNRFDGTVLNTQGCRAVTIGALFQKKRSELEVSTIIERMRAQGIAIVTGTKVTYELPEKSG